MERNETQAKLKSIAIHFSVTKAIDWDEALRQTMGILNTNSREQASLVMGNIIKDLH